MIEIDSCNNTSHEVLDKTRRLEQRRTTIKKNGNQFKALLETSEIFLDEVDNKHSSIHWIRKIVPPSIYTISSFVDHTLRKYIRAHSLYSASQLERKGKKLLRRIPQDKFDRRKKGAAKMFRDNEENKSQTEEAFNCFVSSMKIREEYADFSLELKRSYAEVGRMILEREFVSIPYARIALKCLMRALVIQKVHYDYHRQQKSPKSTRAKNNMKKGVVLDLYSLSYYVAKTFLILGNIDAAYKQITYSLIILKEEIIKESRIKYTEELAECYSTIANILAVRLKTNDDKKQAIQYYTLAITTLQEKSCNSSSVAGAHAELGSFLHDIGDLVGALQHYKNALNIWSHQKVQTIKIKKSLSNLLSNIALVLKDMDQRDEAMDFLNKAFAILPPTSSQLEVAFILGNKSRLSYEYIE